VGLAVVAVSLITVIARPFGRPTILVVVAGYVAVIGGALAWAIVADLRASRRRRQRG
jgi:hypothetical protein